MAERLVKRRRSETAPNSSIEGTLTDDKDVLKLVAKLLAMAIPITSIANVKVGTFEVAFSQIGNGEAVHVVGMCSGSGMGELVFQTKRSLK